MHCVAVDFDDVLGWMVQHPESGELLTLSQLRQYAYTLRGRREWRASGYSLKSLWFCLASLRAVHRYLARASALAYLVSSPNPSFRHAASIARSGGALDFARALEAEARANEKRAAAPLN